MREALIDRTFRTNLVGSGLDGGAGDRAGSARVDRSDVRRRPGQRAAHPRPPAVGTRRATLVDAGRRGPDPGPRPGRGRGAAGDDDPGPTRGRHHPGGPGGHRGGGAGRRRRPRRRRCGRGRRRVDGTTLRGTGADRPLADVRAVGADSTGTGRRPTRSASPPSSPATSPSSANWPQPPPTPRPCGRCAAWRRGSARPCRTGRGRCWPRWPRAPWPPPWSAAGGRRPPAPPWWPGSPAPSPGPGPSTPRSLSVTVPRGPPWPTPCGPGPMAPGRAPPCSAGAGPSSPERSPAGPVGPGGAWPSAGPAPASGRPPASTRSALGVCLGPLDVATGRDLAAAGVPVVATWIDPTVPAPVASGPRARPTPAEPWGRPLPGRTVEVGPPVVVRGGDVAPDGVTAGARVAVDDRGRLRLPTTSSFSARKSPDIGHFRAEDGGVAEPRASNPGGRWSGCRGAGTVVTCVTVGGQRPHRRPRPLRPVGRPRPGDAGRWAAGRSSGPSPSPSSAAAPRRSASVGCSSSRAAPPGRVQVVMMASVAVQRSCPWPSPSSALHRLRRAGPGLVAGPGRSVGCPPRHVPAPPPARRRPRQPARCRRDPKGRLCPWVIRSGSTPPSRRRRTTSSPCSSDDRGLPDLGPRPEGGHGAARDGDGSGHQGPLPRRRRSATARSTRSPTTTRAPVGWPGARSAATSPASSTATTTWSTTATAPPTWPTSSRSS